MAYIGVSPSNGVRNRFQYQATAGQQTFSNADANGLTLTYTDSLYMDVYQNGILLVPGDDYTATTGTTVVLVQAASVDDIVEMVVYDVFSVNDSVSASSGGTFSGNVTMGGTLGVTGVPTFTGRSVHNGGITVANDGQIGSVGDADAMSISSGGVVNFTQSPTGGPLVKLLEQDISTSDGTFVVNNTYINSTYDRYFIFYEIHTSTEDDRQMQLKFYMTTNASGDAGSIISGNHHSYGNSMIGSASEVSQNNTSSYAVIGTTEIKSGAGQGITFNGILQNVNSTDNLVTFNGVGSVLRNSNGAHNGFTFHAGMATPGTYGAYYCRGILFQLSGGQHTGKFRLYGFN